MAKISDWLKQDLRVWPVSVALVIFALAAIFVMGRITIRVLDDEVSQSVESQGPCAGGRAPELETGYFDGQFIFMGRQNLIDELIADAGIADSIASKRLLATFSRNPLDEPAREGATLIRQFAQGQSGDADDYLWLYSTTCDLSTLDALSALHSAHSATGYSVVFEPNWLLSSDSVSAQTPTIVGDPTDSIAPIGPHTVQGTSGWSPSDVHNAIDAQRNAARIRLDGEFEEKPTEISRVVIFDNYAPDFPKTIPHAFPTSLTVSVVNQYTLVSTSSNHGKKDHGLFTAGIIHSMAPTTNITVHAILNEFGYGALSELLSALSTEINASPNDMSDSVLHFGLHVVSSTPVASLRALIGDADALGATSVAATGNFNSYYTMGTTGVVNPPRQPASYADISSFTNIFSVGGFPASAFAGTFGGNACFTSDVTSVRGIREFAGWAMVKNPPSVNQEQCHSQISHHRCLEDTKGEILVDGLSKADAVPCAQALIGLSLSNPSPNLNDDTKHGYWIGTSFSAATVSGFLAGP